MKAGALKAIAITSPERVNSFPGVPTVSEAGLPGFQASLWYGLWVRHGTAPDIIKKLNEATSKALADPGVAGKLTALGVHITPKAKQSPETLRAFQEGRSGALVANHQGGQHQDVTKRARRSAGALYASEPLFFELAQQIVQVERMGEHLQTSRPASSATWSFGRSQ